MLVFSAIVPHSPLLIPNIGGSNRQKLEKTIEAYKFLKDEFVKAAPETILVVSPHGTVFSNAFSINTNMFYRARFENFGDFETELNYKPDLGFINSLKGTNETRLAIQLISEENLDHGVSVPLYFLLGHNTKRRIVPISYSNLALRDHVKFGEMIKESLFASDKRFAVIASADLSHRLAQKSPEGFSPRAKEFDKKVIQLLKKKNLNGLLNLETAAIEEARECGLRSILILLGIMKNMDYDFEVLNYESPFGVGYLCGQFKLK